MAGQKFTAMTDNSIEKTTMLIIWISAFLSSAIDNIPFVATMIPMLKSIEESLGGREAMMPVWWALSLGSCFGGNGTLIAASANVIDNFAHCCHCLVIFTYVAFLAIEINRMLVS